MEIPPEAISELKEIYNRQYGEILTDTEAIAMAGDLFSLFLSIYEPFPEDWLNEL